MKCLSGLPQGHALRDRRGESMLPNLVLKHYVKIPWLPWGLGKENWDPASQIKHIGIGTL